MKKDSSNFKGFDIQSAGTQKRRRAWWKKRWWKKVEEWRRKKPRDVAQWKWEATGAHNSQERRF